MATAALVTTITQRSSVNIFLLTFPGRPLQVQRPSFFKSNSLYFESAFLTTSFGTFLPFIFGGPVIALPLFAPSTSCLARACNLFSPLAFSSRLVSSSMVTSFAGPFVLSDLPFVVVAAGVAGSFFGLLRQQSPQHPKNVKIH